MSNETALIIERVFKCSPEMLFDMWTKPEHLEKWWAPKGFTTEVLEYELKEGGKFLYEQKNDEGMGQIGLFIYETIDQPNKLVFKSGFADRDGQFIAPGFHPDFPKVLYNVVEVFEDDNGARIKTTGMPFEGKENENQFFESMHDNMREGFKGTYDHLDEYLEQIK